MKKIKYSDFESVKDIISQIDFSFNEDSAIQKERFYSLWTDIVGDKLSKLSKPIDIKDNGTLIISCANSFIANELFMIKKHLLSTISNTTQNTDIKISNLYFDYKNWV